MTVNFIIKYFNLHIFKVISLAEACGINSRVTVHHEVGHALGRFHEFDRPDRNDYLIISSYAETYSRKIFVNNTLQ